MGCVTSSEKKQNKEPASSLKQKGKTIASNKDDEEIMLYKNKDFRVLHVPPDARTMTVIKPSHSSRHRTRIKRQGYYALSHLWGNVKEFPTWDVGSFVTENGCPVDPIPIRPEKRRTLLALLKAHPDTYWWIDVLCARSDTPLVIMGDIYRHCNECYAMLDCAPDLIPKMWEKRMVLERLHKRCEELQADDPALMVHERQEFAIQLAKTLIDEGHGSIFEIVHLLFSCRWFDRVWTLQEIVLPKVVMLISETCNYDSTEHQISFGFIAQSLGPIVDGHTAHHILPRVGEQMAFIINALGKKLQMVLQCTALRVNPYNDPVENAAIVLNIFASIGRCRRTCMDPRDYVYGVLGLLGMDIPRVDDNTQSVWITFLSVLETMIEEHTTISRTGERLLTISSHAWNFRLALAKDSDHVYGMLLDVHFDKGIYNYAMSEIHKKAQRI